MAPIHSEFQVPKNDQKGSFLGINCTLVKTHTNQKILENFKICDPG